MKASAPLLKKVGATIQLLRVRHAQTFMERFKGLLGTRPEDHDFALVFHLAESGKLNASIHMVGMAMPIDVLFLNASRKVVDRVENLLPWTLNYTPKSDSTYIVELPRGTISAYAIRENDGVNWK